MQRFDEDLFVRALERDRESRGLDFRATIGIVEDKFPENRKQELIAKCKWIQKKCAELLKRCDEILAEY